MDLYDLLNNARGEITDLKEEIAALKEELDSESAWAKEYKEKLEAAEERLEAWRAVRPMLRYPNWPDSGNQWITDAIDKLKDLGEI
jgi:DNA gyrase/topoisomerase IV subunit A